MKSPKKSNIQSIYPLSPMQSGMLNQILATGHDQYFVQLNTVLKGRLDIEAFQAAWATVFERHTTLRTVFVWKGRKEPIQVVLARQSVPWKILDWRDRPAQDQTKAWQAFLESDRQQGLDLSKPPLMRLALIRLSEERYQFLWSTHHILMDGWCTKLLLNEVNTLYQARQAGKPLQLPPARPYRDYIKWLERQDKAQAKTFWQTHLSEFQAPTPLPWKRAPKRIDEGQPTYAFVSEYLPQADTDRLESISKQHRLTMNTLVQGAWALLLNTFSGHQDIVFGITTSGRPDSIQGIQSMIGLFINTLPMRVEVDPDLNLLDWLHQIQNVQVEMRRYEFTPLFDIQAWSELGQDVLFQSLLIYQNYPRQETTSIMETDALDSDEIDVQGAGAYPIYASALWINRLNLQINFDTRYFERDRAEQLLHFCLALLKTLPDHLHHKLQDIPNLPLENYARVVHTPAAITIQDTTAKNLLARIQAPIPPEDRVCIEIDGPLMGREFESMISSIQSWLSHHPKIKVLYLPIAPEVSSLAITTACLRAHITVVAVSHPGSLPTASHEEDEIGLYLTHQDMVALLRNAAPDQVFGRPIAGNAVLHEAGPCVLAQDSISEASPTIDSPQRWAYLHKVWQLQAGDRIHLWPDRDWFHWLEDAMVTLSAGAILDLRPLTPHAVNSRTDPPTVIHAPISAWQSLCQSSGAPLGPWRPNRIFCQGEQPDEALRKKVHALTGLELRWYVMPPWSCTPIFIDSPDVDKGARPVSGSAILLDPYLRAVPAHTTGTIFLASSAMSNAPVVTLEHLPRPTGTHLQRDLIWTGLTGTRSSAGHLHILNTQRSRWLWKDDRAIDLDKMTDRLLKLPFVSDAHIVPRQTQAGQWQSVAYLAMNRDVGPAELRNMCQARWAEDELPDHYLTVKYLPYCVDGTLDLDALVTLPVVDETAIAAWEKKILGDNHQATIVLHHRGASNTELQWRRFWRAWETNLLPHLEALSKRHTTEQTPPLVAQPFATGFTPLQNWIWAQQYLDQSNIGFHHGQIFQITGQHQINHLISAWEALVSQITCLQTGLTIKGVNPIPKTCRGAAREIRVIDLQTCREDRKHNLFQKLHCSNLHRPFYWDGTPLVRLCLYRLATDQTVVSLVFHSLWIDPCQVSHLISLWFETYGDCFAGKEPNPIPPTTGQYGEVDTTADATDEIHLSTVPSTMDLPFLPQHDKSSLADSSYIPFKIDPTVSTRVTEFAAGHQVSPGIVYFTVFQMLLLGLSNQANLRCGVRLDGSPSEVQPLKQASTILDRVVNVERSPDRSFDKTLEHIVFAIKTSARNTHSAQWSTDDQEDPYRTLFSIVTEIPPELAGASVKSLDYNDPSWGLDLTCYMTSREDEWQGRLVFSEMRLASNTVRNLVQYFVDLVTKATIGPEKSVASLMGDLLHVSDRFIEPAHASDDPPPYQRIDHWFAHTVRAAPNQTALVVNDEKFSFWELNQKAESIAAALQDLGIRPGNIVAICLQRNANLVPAMLAVLKTGATYVPIDPAYPYDRVAYMLRDSQAAVVITQDPQLEIPSATDRLDPRAVADSSGPRAYPCEPAHLSHIIYTSGSTGLPKGVAIRHRSVSHLLAWIPTIFSADEMAVTLAGTSICFDLSIFEIFGTLCHGGTVLMAENTLEAAHDPAFDQVTLINTVPSALEGLVRSYRLPHSTRVVNLAGEPLRRHLVDRIFKDYPHVRVLNLYGPSEDTTYSTVACILADDSHEPDIGLPVDGSRALVLHGLTAMPAGAIGELCLAGAGLALGYFQKPRQTAEKFVPNPFATEAGERIYRTGDLVRQQTDGALQFLGRMDSQVKVRGLRIELGEIETNLLRHQALRECAVTVLVTPNGEQEIVAYLVVDSKTDPQQIETTCRQILARHMPHYMVPGIFMFLDRLPRTPNGKLDGKRLPLPKNWLATQQANKIHTDWSQEPAREAIPSAFAIPIWQRHQAKSYQRVPQRPLVLWRFDNRYLPSETIPSELIDVIPGKAFHQLSDSNYVLDPSSTEEYDICLETIEQTHGLLPLEHIIALGQDMAAEHCQDDLVTGLKWAEALVTSIVNRSTNEETQQVLFSLRGSFSVSDQGKGTPSAYMLRYSLQNLKRNYPNIAIRILDTTTDEDQWLNASLTWLQSPGQLSQAAFRKGTFWIQRWHRESIKNPPLTFHADQGFVVLLLSATDWAIDFTEALGQIETPKVHLISQDPIPNQANHPLQQLLQKLRDFGCNLYHSTVTAQDPDRLSQAIAQASTFFGTTCRGLLVCGNLPGATGTPNHLAGWYAASLALTTAIDRAMDQHRPDLFVWLTPSYMAHGYTSIPEAWLSALAEYHVTGLRQQGFLNTVHIRCCYPHDLSLKHPLHQTEGWLPLSRWQWVLSILTAMNNTRDTVYVGVDEAHPDVWSTGISGHPAMHEVTVCHTLPERGTWENLDLHDPFGRVVPLENRVVSVLPRRKDGTVDKEALNQTLHQEPGRDTVTLSTTEQQLVAIWERILGLKSPAINQTFFDLGGHSITLTQLGFEIQTEFGVTLPNTILFDNPTVRSLAKAIEKTSDQSSDLEEDVDLEREARLPNTIKPGKVVPSLDQSPSAILLTGATGFVGAFLLAGLLETTDADIYCLIRANDDTSAKVRLIQSLNEFQLSASLKDAMARIKPIAGDLAADQLGMPDSTYTHLTEHIDVIYHNGAQVNFVYGYDTLKPANVEGTQRILTLATTGTTKPVHFISTLGVFSKPVELGRPITEDEPLDPQRVAPAGYPSTKWVAERMIRHAGDRGLPITIFRLGRVSGHSQTGACGKDDMIVRILQGSLRLGAAPQADIRLEMSPVDTVVSALLYLSRQNQSKGRVFHLNSPHEPVDLNTLLNAAQDAGLPLQTVPAATWRDMLIEAAKNDPDNPVFPLLSQLAPREDENRNQQDPPVTFSNRATQAALTNFDGDWPAVDRSQFGIYFRFFLESGMISAPAETK